MSDFFVPEDEGALLELNDPYGNPWLKPDGKPVTIRLAGMDTTRWQKARDSVFNRVLKTSGPRGPQWKTAEEQRGDEAFMLASVTIAWDGVTDTECTPANAKQFYLSPQNNFIREQVDAFVGERRNFLKASS